MPVDMAPPTSFSNLPQIQPPQSEGILQTAQQVNALRMAPLQQQAAQQQLQKQQMDLQQQTMDLQDQQKWREIYQQSNGNMDQAFTAAAKAGVGPRTLMPIQQSWMQMQAERAKLTESQRQIQDANAEGMYRLLSPVAAMKDPVAQKAAYDQAVQNGHDSGYLTDAEAAAHQYPGGPDGVNSQLLGYQTVKGMSAAGTAQRGAAATTDAQIKQNEFDLNAPSLKEKADQAKRAGTSAVLMNVTSAADWDKNRDSFVADGGNPAVFPPASAPGMFDAGGKITPAGQNAARVGGLNSEQATTAAQAAANAKQSAQPKTEAELSLAAVDPNGTDESRGTATAALSKFTQSQRAAHPPSVNQFLIPGVPTAPTTKTGEDFLATLPAWYAAKIKNMDAGGEPVPTGRAAMSGPGLQLSKDLYSYDPTFTSLTAQNRSQTLRQYTNSANTSAGGQVLALNTLVHHADLYMDIADSLKNGTWRSGNALYNRVATEFGAAPPTQANLVGRFLAGETGKVATGGVPAEGEINGILQNLGSNASPDQIKGAGNALLGVAAGRMVPLREKADLAGLTKRGGGPSDFVRILGPDAQAILQRRGYDPETLRPAGQNSNPSGGSGYVRTSTGSGGHQIGQTSDGKWHDVRTGAVIQ